MRLVKKTVNFDNHNVYHFYYGTELGAPGTIWTTFPYKGYGVRVGSKGAGQVVTTVFSVPWDRWSSGGIACATRVWPANDVEAHFGEPAIAFSDPSGLSVRADRHRSRRTRAVDARGGRRMRRRFAACIASDDGQAGRSRRSSS